MKITDVKATIQLDRREIGVIATCIAYSISNHGKRLVSVVPSEIETPEQFAQLVLSQNEHRVSILRVLDGLQEGLSMLDALKHNLALLFKEQGGDRHE